MFATINHNLVDKDSVHLVLTGVRSDGDFYKNVIQPNAKSIEKRMLRGKFQKDFAEKKKTFIDRIGKDAIDHYHKEDDYDNEDPIKTNIDTKRMIGQEIVKDIIREARETISYDKLDTPKLKAMIARDQLKTVEENAVVTKGISGLR